MRISDWSSDVCSSDLSSRNRRSSAAAGGTRRSRDGGTSAFSWPPARADGPCRGVLCHGCYPYRSEEHTSELQSLMRISYAVFCLTKKTAIHQQNTKSKQKNYTDQPNDQHQHTPPHT